MQRLLFSAICLTLGCISDVYCQETTDTYTLDYSQFVIGGSVGESTDYGVVDTLRVASDDAETQVGGSYLVENVIDNDDRVNIPILSAQGTKVRLEIPSESLPKGAVGYRIMRAYVYPYGGSFTARELVVGTYCYIHDGLLTGGVYYDYVEPNQYYAYLIEVELSDGTRVILTAPMFVQSGESINTHVPAWDLYQ
ncbi:hypothetical protein JXA32_08985 [Candidatus Sumerlaeota bacterium]|nr:hypothetical protein [Candidatus Sumerlaeota bacterium]